MGNAVDICEVDQASKRPLLKQYNVLDHFKHLENKTWECLTCRTPYSKAISYNTLRKHYENVHRGTRPILEAFQVPTKTTTAFIMDFVVAGQHALRIVEEEKFIELMRHLKPGIKPPSRRTIGRELASQFQVKKAEFIRRLEGVFKVALTTDMWTSMNSKPYMVITCHYIHPDTNRLEHYLLDFLLVPYPHTSANMAIALKNSVTEYNLLGRVVSFTTDNASTMPGAVRGLIGRPLEDSSNGYHFGCLAHIINLAVVNALKKSQATIDHLRGLVKFVRRSPKNLQLLEETSRGLKEVYVVPKLDCITRWSSTYDMITQAIKIKKVLNYLGQSEIRFSNFVIAESTWRGLEDTLLFLSTFAEATTLISASNYPSISFILPVYNTLFEHAVAVKEAYQGPINHMAIGALEVLTKYTDLVRRETILATLLDPRLKLASISEEKVDEYKKLLEDAYDARRPLVEVSQNSTESSAMSFKQKLFKKRRICVKSEVTEYFLVDNAEEHTDPIEWWVKHKQEYPILSSIALDLLFIPATGVPSEQAFSKAGDTVTKKRNRLCAKTIQMLVLLNSWMNLK